jgi:hypothetical protein
MMEDSLDNLDALTFSARSLDSKFTLKQLRNSVVLLKEETSKKDIEMDRFLSSIMFGLTTLPKHEEGLFGPNYTITRESYHASGNIFLPIFLLVTLSTERQRTRRKESKNRNSRVNGFPLPSSSESIAVPI